MLTKGTRALKIRGFILIQGLGLGLGLNSGGKNFLLLVEHSPSDRTRATRIQPLTHKGDGLEVADGNKIDVEDWFNGAPIAQRR
jgi:hypothetical protein